MERPQPSLPIELLPGRLVDNAPLLFTWRAWAQEATGEEDLYLANLAANTRTRSAAMDQLQKTLETPSHFELPEGSPLTLRDVTNIEQTVTIMTEHVDLLGDLLLDESLVSDTNPAIRHADLLHQDHLRWPSMHSRIKRELNDIDNTAERLSDMDHDDKLRLFMAHHQATEEHIVAAEEVLAVCAVKELQDPECPTPPNARSKDEVFEEWKTALWLFQNAEDETEKEAVRKELIDDIFAKITSIEANFRLPTGKMMVHETVEEIRDKYNAIQNDRTQLTRKMREYRSQLLRRANQKWVEVLDDEGRQASYKDLRKRWSLESERSLDRQKGKQSIRGLAPALHRRGLGIYESRQAAKSVWIIRGMLRDTQLPPGDPEAIRHVQSILGDDMVEDWTYQKLVDRIGGPHSGIPIAEEYRDEFYLTDVIEMLRSRWLVIKQEVVGNAKPNTAIAKDLAAVEKVLFLEPQPRDGSEEERLTAEETRFRQALRAAALDMLDKSDITEKNILPEGGLHERTTGVRAERPEIAVSGVDFKLNPDRIAFIQAMKNALGAKTSTENVLSTGKKTLPYIAVISGDYVIAETMEDGNATYIHFGPDWENEETGLCQLRMYARRQSHVVRVEHTTDSMLEHATEVAKKLKAGGMDPERADGIVDALRVEMGLDVTV